MRAFDERGRKLAKLGRRNRAFALEFQTRTARSTSVQKTPIYEISVTKKPPQNEKARRFELGTLLLQSIDL